ncbi:Heterogeneous nuclear ribonucleoprotein 1 [Sesamum angolense]|uniref:Heterogeneous nuclear ribonucleoprotein 1 n=1 Tax=Sesamum angolense TaxID=2727404 RepID=A0AAE2BUT7_9LAMI|nr:Heterogeneous nuclear ribonucleoprotein 1 [Sesamum angolense]
MRDRTTGRARGFGFVVFADPAVAERVVKEKHMIDGRTVEAKKAVPRDDQHLINRNSGSIQGSPGPGRTKKIFVGGLASTVTESDFKNYFDQFGTIMDVVVMYDHNTQRPREQFQKNYLRAQPGPLVGYNYGFNRANNFLNNYAHGYNLGSVGGYGVRMDSRYNTVTSGRAGFSHFGSPAYGMGVNMEQGLNGGFGGGSNFSSNLGYGRVLSPYFGSNQGSSGSYFGSGSGGFGVFGNNGANWGTSPIGAPLGGNSSGYNGGNVGYRVGENNYPLGAGGFGRNSGTGVATTSSFAASSADYEGSYGDFYRSGSVYGDPTWQSASSELENSGSFGYGLGNSEDVTAKDSEDYGVGYDIPNRQSSRGIAA